MGRGKLQLGIAVALTMLVPSGVAAQDDPTLVTTSSGILQGGREGDVIAFRGIPYAHPPVGGLRWRPPQPVEPWDGVRQAPAFGPDCMQPVVEGGEAITTTPSEDCLYLNVWAPASADPGDDLPVLVWVHGGGYVGGGTSIPWFDGARFARQGIVVVTINYRLGRLGFFAHPAVLADNEGAGGNFGYMDQIAALRWVQDEIAAFGGDPSRVTIAGESAGGASVLALLTSPATDGLFGQAVVMSGGGRLPLVGRAMSGGTPLAPSADQVDSAFAASLGIDGDDAAALTALRELPAERLAELDLVGLFRMALGCQAQELADPAAYDPACRPALSGTPMIDGTIVTGTPQDVFRAGGARTVPLLIGTTAADLPEYFPPRITDPWAVFGEDAQAAERHYRLPFLVRAALVLRGQERLRDLLPLVSLSADMTMHEPARFVARQMRTAGQPAWLYRFTYTADSTRPDSERQVHAGELPFLFDQLEARYGDAVTDADRRAAGAFNTYVGNFVRAGDPNGGGLPTWQMVDPDALDLLDFTLDDGPVFGRDPRAEGIALVQRLADEAP